MSRRGILRALLPRPVVRRRYDGWQLFCPDIVDRIAIGLTSQPVRFLVFPDELLTVMPLLHRVIRTDEFLPCPEYSRQRLLIVLLDGPKAGTASRLGGREGCLTR